MDNTVVRCNKCGKEQRIVNQLPYGWQRLGDTLFCKECSEAGAKRFLQALTKPKRR